MLQHGDFSVVGRGLVRGLLGEIAGQESWVYRWMVGGLVGGACGEQQGSAFLGLESRVWVEVRMV